MTVSTLASVPRATPFSGELLELAVMLVPLLIRLGQLVRAFPRGAVTPTTTYEFETTLEELLRQVGREAVSWTYNRLEPANLHDLPAQIRVEGEWYRRRPRSTRNSLATLFGTIVLLRYLYEPLETAERSIFPLEMRLGVVAGLATPALAERVGHGSADHTQSSVLANLHREHGIRWGTSSLRKVTAAVSAGLAEQRHAVQVAQVVAWLRQAQRIRHRGRWGVVRGQCLGRRASRVVRMPAWAAAAAVRASPRPSGLPRSLPAACAAPQFDRAPCARQ